MKKKIKINDYVLATKYYHNSYSKKNLNFFYDRFAIGFVTEILENYAGTYYQVDRSEIYFKFASRITNKTGERILKEYKEFCKLNGYDKEKEN
jgi:hypothetical protein